MLMVKTIIMMLSQQHHRSIIRMNDAYRRE